MKYKIKYRSLERDFFEYNALKTDTSFPINNIKVADFDLIEFVYEVRINKENFEEELFVFNKILADLVLSSSKNTFLFGIEHQVKEISRIRSFKGLIDKKRINIDEYIEKEVLISENKSIITFVAKLNSNNINYLINFFHDDSTSFIIASNEEYLNENFIIKIMSLINIKNQIEINYVNVINSFCTKGDIVFRIGGDSGESYWSLQKFTSANNLI